MNKNLALMFSMILISSLAHGATNACQTVLQDSRTQDQEALNLANSLKNKKSDVALMNDLIKKQNTINTAFGSDEQELQSVLESVPSNGDSEIESADGAEIQQTKMAKDNLMRAELSGDLKKLDHSIIETLDQNQSPQALAGIKASIESSPTPTAAEVSQKRSDQVQRVVKLFVGGSPSVDQTVHLALCDQFSGSENCSEVDALGGKLISSAQPAALHLNNCETETATADSRTTTPSRSGR